MSEQAGRFHEQEDDQQHEGHAVLIERRDDQRAEVLEDADEDAAGDRAGQVSEAADDAGREALEADHVGDREVYGEERDDHDADGGADHRAERNCQVDVGGHVDAHEGRGRLVLLDAAHRLAHLGGLEEDLQGGDDDRGDEDDGDVRLGDDDVPDLDDPLEEAGDGEGRTR